MSRKSKPLNRRSINEATFYRLEERPWGFALLRKDVSLEEGFFDALFCADFERGCGAVIQGSEGVSVFAKKYLHGGIFGALLGPNYLSTKRFFRELNVYRRLAGAGIKTPKPVALVVKKKRLFCNVYLLTEVIPSLTPLLYVLKEGSGRKKREVLRQAGAQVALMHKAGVVHGDLTLNNIQFSENGGVVLLDFDNCSFSSSRVRKWHNLFRLHRSCMKLAVWKSDFQERLHVSAFLLGYFGGKAKVGRFVRLAFSLYRKWETFHSLTWREAKRDA